MKKLFSLLALALLTTSAWAANSYVKVTSANQLVAGQKYIIVNEDAVAVMGTVGTYGAAVVSENPITDNVLNINGLSGVVELTLGGAEGAWTFAIDDNTYIAYTNTSDKNQLNTSSDANANTAKWTATVKDGGYILTNVAQTNRVLQYNANSGQERFACYKGTQKDAVLYVEDAGIVTVAAPTLPASQNFTESFTVEITNNEEGATVSYSTDEQATWNTYTVPFDITNTTTVYAKATKNGVVSNVVDATYTKVEAYTVGDVISFVGATDTIAGGSTAGWHEITKDGVTMKFYGTVSNYTTTDSLGNITAEYHQYRIYKNYSVTFTTTVGNIRKIEFQCDNTNPATGFDEAAGLDRETGIWEGNAREITFNTKNKQVRANVIIVTVDDQVPVLDVATPVFDPTSKKFVGSIEVTLTCATEGAEIIYMINDGDEITYNGPFTLTETATVKAYAQTDDAESEMATATYTRLPEVATLAEANALENKTDFGFTGNVIAVYQSGSNLWVKDETGYGLIYGSQVPAISEGATIKSGWDAQYYLFRGHINEYQYPNNVEPTNDALVTIVPNEYTEAAIDTTKINERVIVKGLTLTAGEDAKYLYTADGMPIYNQFNIEYPVLEDGKTYDVEGMVSYYSNAVQIMPITITVHAEEEVMRGDVNMDENVSISDVTALIDYLLSGDASAISVAAADCNLDESVTISDVTTLIDYLLNGAW